MSAGPPPTRCLYSNAQQLEETAMDRRSVLLAGGALAALPLGGLRAQAFPSDHALLRFSRRRPDRPGLPRIRRIGIAHAGPGSGRRKQAGRWWHGRADCAE